MKQWLTPASKNLFCGSSARQYFPYVTNRYIKMTSRHTVPKMNGNSLIECKFHLKDAAVGMEDKP